MDTKIREAFEQMCNDLKLNPAENEMEYPIFKTGYLMGYNNCSKDCYKAFDLPESVRY